MPSHVGPTDPTLPALSHPSLRAGDERCLLQTGLHALGGRAADALVLAALERQPHAATITVSDSGSTTLQRTTASVVVRINGETVGIAPVVLRHGATIEFGECRLIFEAAPSTPTVPTNALHGALVPMTSGSSARAARIGVPGIGSGAVGQKSSGSMQGVSTDAVLIDMRSGARHPLRARRIFIGRDESCDVVVNGSGVSRRHASIEPVSRGFMLRDESANGTRVNGVRVVGTYLLGDGDVVRLHDEELRVELGTSAAPRSIVGGEATAILDLSHITRGLSAEQDRTAASRVLTASLEIERGSFAGASFQIERAVCSIGRGDENDVRIRDDTVSSSHATLLRKGDTWFVVDLRSLNGTFVDGSRVAGERELHTGARVRVGAVELVFRALGAEAQKIVEAPRVSVRARLGELLRSIAPPLGER
ncbi:MAG: FHA domain-containing protein [Gemmatimonadaceae bacterium]